MAGSLEGKKAVVTGASSGIGEATVEALVSEGAAVSAGARRRDRLEALAERVDGAVHVHEVDVTDEAAVLAAARQVREALGGETLAGLVNNAGVAVAGPVLEMSADDFRRQMDINVIGPVISTQAFGPLLGADRR